MELAQKVNMGCLFLVSHMAAWSFRVSYNSSISYIRSELKEKTRFADLAFLNVDEKSLPDDSFQDMYQKKKLLEEAIGLLPTRKRQAIELCKLQGKSYAEAGHILGIAATTVKEHLTEAIRFVGSSLGTGSDCRVLSIKRCREEKSR